LHIEGMPVLNFTIFLEEIFGARFKPSQEIEDFIPKKDEKAVK